MLRYANWTLLRSIRPISFISTSIMSANVAQQRAGHTFAPLKLSREDQTRDHGVRLEGIVFDMDGTLCMFTTLRPTPRDLN
jgi:hypothetical protein